jgi:5'(3')-deoxyribonucleotidase
VRPRLLLDCDGVLADFTGPCLEVLSRHMGQEYHREHVTHWHIKEVLSVPENIWDMTLAEMKLPNFCSSLPVFPGAVDAVQRLKAYADVFIVTSPLDGPYWAWERERWLLRHFDIPPGRVVSTSAKQVVDGDILVDDKTQTLVEWEKEQCGLSVQWVTPHNLHDGWMGLSTCNWDELLGIVKGYSWIRGNPNE